MEHCKSNLERKTCSFGVEHCITVSRQNKESAHNITRAFKKDCASKPFCSKSNLFCNELTSGEDKCTHRCCHGELCNLAIHGKGRSFSYGYYLVRTLSFVLTVRFGFSWNPFEIDGLNLRFSLCDVTRYVHCSNRDFGLLVSQPSYDTVASTCDLQPRKEPQRQGRSQGGPRVPVTSPPLQAFFNQTTYNRWLKWHDNILAIVTIWWVPSLWHSVTPLWKLLADRKSVV